jgi:hypothetical protein
MTAICRGFRPLSRCTVRVDELSEKEDVFAASKKQTVAASCRGKLILLNALETLEQSRLLSG